MFLIIELIVCLGRSCPIREIYRVLQFESSAAYFVAWFISIKRSKYLSNSFVLNIVLICSYYRLLFTPYSQITVLISSCHFISFSLYFSSILVLLIFKVGVTIPFSVDQESLTIIKVAIFLVPGYEGVKNDLNIYLEEAKNWIPYSY